MNIERIGQGWRDELRVYLIFLITEMLVGSCRIYIETNCENWVMDLNYCCFRRVYFEQINQVGARRGIYQHEAG